MYLMIVFKSVLQWPIIIILLLYCEQYNSRVNTSRGALMKPMAKISYCLESLVHRGLEYPRHMMRMMVMI